MNYYFYTDHNVDIPKTANFNVHDFEKFAKNCTNLKIFSILLSVTGSIGVALNTFIFELLGKNECP